MRIFMFKLILLVFFGLVATATAAEPQSAAARGYENLRTHQYLPPDFDEEIFAQLWTVWPEPERTRAENADAKERRRMTMSYYGLTPAPEDTDGTMPALGYVPDGKQGWVMNCLACHGGKVAGRIIPGLPNSHTALQTLTEDVRAVKLIQSKVLSHLDLATLQLPLNTTNGTTNAVVFGIVLGTYRNPDMSVDLNRKLPPLMHHDVDAPPFWNVRKKRSLYSDGHAPKTARPLMQFILLPKLKAEQLTKWEPEFADILAWIESLEAPRYPFEVDTKLAATGELVFKEHCSRCHGTYGPGSRYQQITIPMDEIKTDSVRFDSLTPKHRQWLKDGWLSRYGMDPVEVDPVGYVAPPLDGIWASAPYFHNGSVPTLWHVLHPDQRPVVWKRSEDGYDQAKVGLEIEQYGRVPSSVQHPAHRRRYFDTTKPGKSAAGHLFPNVLDEDQKRAVLEYLKTL
jgi:mono/diheme cytochrome c family protein